MVGLGCSHPPYCKVSLSLFHFFAQTFVGDRLGVIDPMRWSNATEWLLKKNGVADVDNAIDPLMGLDRSNLWQPPSNLLHGNEIGRNALQDAKESAAKFERTYGRRPSLGVIRVGGTGTRYEHSEKRLQLYSNPSNSWFTKADVGMANGFDVTEIELDAASTTTGSLLSEIYRLRDAVDGVQVMWPLPEHIDSAHVFNAVPLSKDVDGIHFASWGSNFPPVTPAGVMELLKGHNVDVRGKHVLVVGRSPIVGSPMALMLRDAGATVSAAHKSSRDADEATFRDLVSKCDVLISCAGSPGAIHADWLKEGVIVINVGTYFCETANALLSDIEGDVQSRAAKYSPVPGGVGPLSIPMLFRNVAKAAWDQMECGTSDTWTKEPATLR